MPERLVDAKSGERLLHTFPATASDRTAEAGDEGFKKKLHACYVSIVPGTAYDPARCGN